MTEASDEQSFSSSVMSVAHVNTQNTSFHEFISTNTTAVESSDVLAVDVISQEVSCFAFLTTILALDTE